MTGKSGSLSVLFSVGVERPLFVALLTLCPFAALGQTADDIVGLGIATDDHSYVWYRGGQVSSGASAQLDWHRTLYPFSAAAGVAGHAGLVPGDVIAAGVACSDDHVYVWTRYGTVISGTSTDHDKYRTARPYSLPPGKTPADIVGVGIAGNDRVYAWYRDGTVSSGTTSNLGRHMVSSPYALPQGKTPEDVVGMAIACSDDHVYAWYRDRTVSSGSSSSLDRYRSRYAYSTPGGRSPAQIAGMGIAGDDRVYAWYVDGTTSSGTTAALGSHRAPAPYTSVPPVLERPQQAPGDVVGMGIACSDSHVYAWYRDGTVSSGRSADLDAYRAQSAYSLPPGKTPADIAGMGIAGDDHVYAWYRDGSVSSGTSTDLDRYGVPSSYSLPSGKMPSQIVGMGIACSNDHVYAWYDDGQVSSGTSRDIDRYKAPYAYSLKLVRPEAPSNARTTWASATSLKLEWRDNSTWERGFRVIQRGAVVASPDRNDESQTLLSLTPDTEYCYTVVAWNRAGVSAPSNEACGRTEHEPPPDDLSGYSQVNIFNCDNDRRTVHIWVRDLSDSTDWSERDSLASQWSGGTCPGNASPLEVGLSDGHLHEVVAVDPKLSGCGGRNDPVYAACRRAQPEQPLLGDANGGPFPLVVN